MGYKDKNEQRKYQQKWYINKKSNSPGYWQAYQRKRRAEIKEFIRLLKTECTRCGYSRCKAVLEFHHVSSIKNGGISEAIKDKWSNTRILEEIEFCELLCANCHREEHYEVGVG